MVAPKTRASLVAWHDGPQFERFMADLVASTVSRLRPDDAASSVTSGLDLDFGPGGINLDSLERLRLASAVAEVLRLGARAHSEALQAQQTLVSLTSEARRCLDTGTTEIGFRSSGSMGMQSFVVHDISMLDEEVHELARMLPGRSRVIALVPAHHIYGFLFTVLLSEHFGVPVVDGRAHAPPGLIALMQPGDLVVAVPTFWTLAAEAHCRWPAEVVGTTSGGPCPPKTAKMLLQSGPDALFEFYGSTETAGIGWRSHPDVPFTLFSYWRCADSDCIVRRHAGQEFVRELPDYVTWTSVDQLRPVARRDGAVQIAGVNVDPARVQALLLTNPRVAEARVRLMRPDEGDRLKAFIVPRDDGLDRQALRRELESWLKPRLSPLEQPRSYSFGVRLPRNEMGKEMDWSARQEHEQG